MASQMHSYLKNISENIFGTLTEGEELSLSLHSEESDFIRFTQSQVRQNTQVIQHELTMQYQANARSYRLTLPLTLDENADIALLTERLQEIRQTLPLLDENPQITPMVNNGVSEVYKKSDYPKADVFIEKVSRNFAGADLVGLFCAGPIRQASLNSKGQFHYFENDHFFFDYSVYDGPRAAKGYYSTEKWDDQTFAAQAAGTLNTLSLLKRPAVQVKPGQHRTYLAPMAVAEIVDIFSWRAVSRAAYEQGFTPLKKLYTGEQLFSPLFSLIENNDLGMDSHFNSYGEPSPLLLPVIENGEMKNFLVNTTTAKEYKVVSNNAGTGEGLRSAEVRAGTLNEADILKQLGTGLYLTNLHYINWSDPQAARLTGMTRFACFWVENGEIVGPIQDLRFDDNLYRIFGSELVGLTQDRSAFINTLTYQKRRLGGMIVPGALLKEMNFTL
jgi:predicted Zn-dependent protease